MKRLAFYESDGGSQIIGDQGLGDIVAGAADVPIKIGIRNDGTEDWPSTITPGSVGGSDGVSMLRIGADTAGTLSPPYDITANVSASGSGGSWGATGDYLAVVTRVNANGETVASVEGRGQILDTTQTITWGWSDDEPLGGDTYNVYRRSSSGTYATPSLIATGVVTTSVLDDGTMPSSGAPPIVNETGGVGPTYGTPPTMGLGPVELAAALKPGQWTFVWVSRVVPDGTTDDDNTRFAAWDFS